MMLIDIRFIYIHKVEDGTRRGLQVEVTARAEGGGCLDRQQMQKLRGDIFEYLNAQLPKCIKEKGAAK